MATRGTQGTEDEIFEFAAAPHIIKRPRLTRILDEGDSRVMVLWAPAGYGKTTLAREWVATRDERVFWHSGGPSMADVAAFAVDLAELFAGKESDLAERVRFLAARGEPPRVLAKAVSTGAPDAAALVVVDDYHYAGEGTDADEFFRELFELTSFRLLLGSRVRPAWIDARKTVYGEALVVEQEALAFTPDEGAAVLPDGGSVLEQAHGWPAVIGLAAARDISSISLGQLAPADLYEFVANDLFAAAPASLRRTLMALAAGGDTTREVARTILGDSLETDVRAGLNRGFLVRSEDGWIAIHPLLRRVLIRQLDEAPLAEKQAIITTTLEALVANKRWDGCLALLSDFPRKTDAANVFELALPDLLAAGRTTTLWQWVDLAESHSFTHAIFTLARAEVALRQGNDADACALATDAATSLSGDLAATAFVTAARAAHQLDDTRAVEENADRAAALAESPALRTQARWLGFMNAYERAPERAREHFELLRDVDDGRREHRVLVLSAQTNLLFGEKGHPRRALEAAREALTVAKHVRDPRLRTNTLHVYAHLLMVCGEYDASLQSVTELLAEAERSGLGFVTSHALLTRAGSSIGRRALSEARAALRNIDALAGTVPQHILANAAVHKAKLQIATGNLEAASLLLESAKPSTASSEGEHLGLRALIAASRSDLKDAEGLAVAARKRSTYEDTTAYVELAEAIVDLQRREDDAASASIVLALVDRGNVDAVVTASRSFPLFAKAAVSGGARSQLEHVFSLSRDLDLGRRAGLSMPRELRTGETLSPREFEVYELLVQGRSNPEIAETLFISKSTAKVHIRHIFEKLGVHSRAEAAAVFTEIARSKPRQ